MKITLNNNIKEILTKLTSHNFEAYLVGGFVRDSLLGIEGKDYDITTNAKPNQIKDCFKDYKIAETGIKHGTVTVIDKDHTPYEITTYRIDEKYRDFRHPSTVIFAANLENDLARRDFTINALCYDLSGNLIDHYNGVDDLNNHTIRAIGDANVRFNEDALRILRAIRFAAQLDFKIEANTSKAIFENKALLKNIAIERISDEFFKTLEAKHCADVLFTYRTVLYEFIPELKELELNPSYLNKTYELLDKSPNSISIRCSVLFHLLGVNKDLNYNNNINIVNTICNRLKFPNVIKNKILYLLNNYQKSLSTKYDIKVALKYNDSCFIELLNFKNVIENKDNINIKSLYDEIINNKECYSLKDLSIKGNDLLELGYKDSDISKTLDLCLDAVMRNDVENNKDTLLAYIKATC